MVAPNASHLLVVATGMPAPPRGHIARWREIISRGIYCGVPQAYSGQQRRNSSQRELPQELVRQLSTRGTETRVISREIPMRVELGARIVCAGDETPNHLRINPRSGLFFSFSSHCIVVIIFLPRYYEKCYTRLGHTWFISSFCVYRGIAFDVRLSSSQALLPRMRPLLSLYIYAVASFYPALFMIPPQGVSTRLSFLTRRAFEYEDDASVTDTSPFLSLRRNAAQTVRYQGIIELSAPHVAQITVLLKNLRNRCYHELPASSATLRLTHPIPLSPRIHLDSAFIVRLHRPAPYHTIIDLDLHRTPLSIPALSPSTSRISHSDVGSAQDTAPMHAECFPATHALRVVLKTSTSPNASTSTSQA
ncbi:hypothetical protein C8R44DRAFT_750261 [Mycena epipterygia]|nr:hypothetical protein C8R44DRAFT_750261 [Mycena epipterygia]